ncbi:Nucleic acid-binding, OB-fold, partial [Sesbania bispinosa]
MALPSVDFYKVRNVSATRDSWVIKVFINRIWYVTHEYNPKDFLSLEMLGIDSQGSKTQLTLYKYLMSVMQVAIREGKVYAIKKFSMIPNGGRFRATRHNYRIVLQRRTLITRVECDMLMNTGLAPLTTSAMW